MVYEESPWRAYKRVNELFADAVAQEVTKGSLIWIHDYHLMLLPQLLRERLGKLGRQCVIGFSLHTPFPAADFWRALPVRNELMEGMLASDLIGFHTEEYRQNFTGTCVNMYATSSAAWLFLWTVGLGRANVVFAGVLKPQCRIKSSIKTA